MANLAGERFDVNVPGEYVLFRLPADVSKPALLQLNASLTRRGDAGESGVYMTLATLTGAWLDEDIVQVRPLARNKAGSNTAGNETLWEFSMRVSRPGLPGKWIPVPGGKLGQMDSIFYNSREHKGSPVTVRAYAARKEPFGRCVEAQQFVFHIGQGKEPAVMNIAQASRQALNIAITDLSSLAHIRLGGLLGTEPHDKALEAPPSDECATAKALRSSKLARISQPSASARW